MHGIWSLPTYPVRAFVKYILASFAIILMLVSEVYAKDDKWIDGISIRYGTLRNNIYINLHETLSVEETIIYTERTVGRQGATPASNIAIALPETLMNSWSFRGAFFEFELEKSIKDLAPKPDDGNITSETTHWRQKSSDRTSLYNDFFNTSDKAFADSNPKWALSADINNSTRYFLGYHWGMFIPIGKNHRLLKIGIGPTIYYMNMSIKLNLCSQYKITPNLDDDHKNSGECVGKTEIDSSSINKFGISFNLHATLWERFTEDSIWKVVSGTTSTAENNDLKLKKHNDLKLSASSATELFISYTYRF